MAEELRKKRDEEREKRKEREEKVEEDHRDSGGEVRESHAFGFIALRDSRRAYQRFQHLDNQTAAGRSNLQCTGLCLCSPVCGASPSRLPRISGGGQSSPGSDLDGREAGKGTATEVPGRRGCTGREMKSAGTGDTERRGVGAGKEREREAEREQGIEMKCCSIEMKEVSRLGA